MKKLPAFYTYKKRPKFGYLMGNAGKMDVVKQIHKADQLEPSKCY